MVAAEAFAGMPIANASAPAPTHLSVVLVTWRRTLIERIESKHDRWSKTRWLGVRPTVEVRTPRATNNVPARGHTDGGSGAQGGGVRALAGVLVALALGAGPAHAQVPDPLAPGPYGYKKIEHSAGT